HHHHCDGEHHHHEPQAPVIRLPSRNN
ncbi:MAG: zinc ABC transporter ATP-binding protein ZnuC, partial [Aeromonas sp.]|nr:zinc ABC transporter ATP-binding protein ZnuC [Aeromonas sp.]